MLAEHAGPPDVDAVLDFYNQLVDHVAGRIQKAEGTRELNEALSTVVSMWAEIEEDRERLLVEFELVGEFEHRLPGGVPILPEFQQGRMSLPPRLLDDRLDPEPLQTGTHTLVNRRFSRAEVPDPGEVVMLPPLEVSVPT